MTASRLICSVAATAVLAGVIPSQAFDPLPRAQPVDMGIDPVALDQVMTAFAEVDGLWAIVVVRQGAVVAERHLIAPPETLHPVWSVTKSITSTLMGSAIDDGLLDDVDVKLSDFLPIDLVPEDPIKRLISMEHLLTMTSGLDWSEDLDWLDWLASEHPALFILERPLTSLPGTQFNYSSASAHLLSLMLTTSSTERLDEFADRELWEPLGITEWMWDSDPQEYSFGGHGVHLRTEDLAKLGLLFLNDGLWSQQEIVPSDWVTQAVEPQFNWGDSFGPLDNLDYGYLWWIADAAGYPVYLAWGWGGQFVFCIPQLDLVIATAADGEVSTARAEAQELGILGVIVNSLIPAVPIATVFTDGFESGSSSAWSNTVP